MFLVASKDDGTAREILQRMRGFPIVGKVLVTDPEKDLEKSWGNCVVIVGLPSSRFPPNGGTNICSSPKKLKGLVPSWAEENSKIKRVVAVREDASLQEVIVGIRHILQEVHMMKVG